MLKLALGNFVSIAGFAIPSLMIENVFKITGVCVGMIAESKGSSDK